MIVVVLRYLILFVWTDAWLASLALSLDYELTTFDRGFKSFQGLNLELLTRSDD